MLPLAVNPADLVAQASSPENSFVEAQTQAELLAVIRDLDALGLGFRVFDFSKFKVSEAQSLRYGGFWGGLDF